MNQVEIRKRTAQFQIKMLGTPSLEWRGQSFSLSRKQARALVYVLAATLEPVSRDRLIFLFWPDTPEATARRNLSRVLSYIRKALPHPDIMQVNNETLALNPQLVWSDAAHFSDLAKRNSPANQEAMVALYDGLFLSGFDLPHNPEYDSWLTVQRGGYEVQYLAALKNLVLDKFSDQDYTSAIDCAQQYLAIDEISEDIHQQLIRLYAAIGDRSAAMRQFEACRLILERELGVEPLPETRRVYETALSGKASSQPALHTKPTWAVLPSLDLPLIGREAAWDALENAYSRLQDGGVILISGEPGIGKSRLLQEYATSKNRLVLSGNCHASTQALPYQPLTQALRQALSLPHLWEGIQPIWLTETGRLLPELGDHFSNLPQLVDVEPDQAQARVYEALSQSLLGLAGNEPLLLCLDDLQWVDEATAGWLTYLSNRLVGGGLCILATYRIEEKERIRDLRETFNRLDRLTEISLAGLSSEAIRVMLEGLTNPPTQPGNLAERIANATGGNPFFVLETIRSLLENESLAALPSTLPLADTVQEAIQRRLDGLTPVARQLLEAAGVLSPDLGFKVLQETAGRSELEVADGLDELVNYQLLTYDDTYHFKHDLINQVTYMSLSPWRRKLLHRRAAEALNQVYKGKLDSVHSRVAHHYQVSGDSKLAIRHYRMAALSDQRLYAHNEAINHLRQAIVLFGEDSFDNLMSVKIHEQLADSLAFTGQYKLAQEGYQEAINDAPESERLWHADLQRKLASTLTPQQRYDEAVAAYQVALSMLGPKPVGDSLNWQSAWLDIQLDLMDGLYMQGSPQEMTRVSAEILPILETIGTPEQRADYNIRLGMLNMRKERYRLSEETVSYKVESLRYAVETGDRQRIARSHFSLGFTTLWSGDLEGAHVQLTTSLEIAREIGNLLLQDQCLAYLTILYRLRRDTSLLHTVLPEAQDVARTVNHPAYIGVYQANAAWLAYLDEDWSAAQERAQTAIAEWGASNYPLKWLAYWILLASALRRKKLAQAVEYIQAMLDPIQQRLPGDVTDALEQGLESWDANRVDGAREALKKAVKLAKTARIFVV